MIETPEIELGRDIPDRSLAQRMDALTRANDIRTYRAQLKRDVKGGRENIVSLLSNPPEKICTMKVVDLLLSVPKVGRTKVNKLMNTCRMSPSKTIEGMTDRQRNELLALLRRYSR